MIPDWMRALQLELPPLVYADVLRRWQEQQGEPDFTIYTCPDGADYGFVTDKDWFEYADDPVTTTRRRYRLVDEVEMTWYPPLTLCPQCHGEGVIPAPPDVYEVTCRTCDGDGCHPQAGEWVEVVTREQ